MQSVNDNYAAEWMFSKQVANYLGLDPKYFSEKFIFKTPDFPRAVRLTDKGHRRWLRSEINQWINTRRVAA